MLNILHNTPSARVLVVAPTEQRAQHAAQLFATTGCEVALLGESKPKNAQIICGTLDQCRKELRYLGVIDFMLLDTCYNMVPLVGTTKEKAVRAKLLERNRSLVVKEYGSPPPVLGLAPVQAGWVCGANPLPGRVPQGLRLQQSTVGRCGYTNQLEHFYCRRCGGFRGFEK